MSFDALRLYAKTLGRVGRLAPEEELSLARGYRRTGDARAADRLVTANLRFVVKIAFEYRSCGIEMADLVQEGVVGLVEAVRRFDPDKGIRLASYAVWWIRAHILEHIIGSYSLVRLGTTQAQRKLFFKLARTRRELERARRGGGADPAGVDPRQIAQRLHVKPAQVEEMGRRLEARDVSLDAPRAGDERTTLLDSLRSERPLPDEELSIAREQRALQRHVKEAVAKLDRRERRLVELRLLSDEPGSFRSMGNRVGLSAERVRQLEVRAERKLEAHLQPLANELGWLRGAGRRTGAWPPTGPARPAAFRAAAGARVRSVSAS